MTAPLALLPVPRSLERTPGALVRRPGAVLEPDLEPDPKLPPEGYELHITTDGIRIRAADENGVRHARSTLAQLGAQCEHEIPALRIRDWPDFPVRGYMLDVSRDRVPTRDTLDRLVELLARLRVNQLQLYTEHTFAYTGHEQVWRDASPLTPDDVRALDAHCAAHGIELVPNQNSFGHMERWLRWPDYQHLAELPGESGAACLAPDEESLRFVRALYAELLPCFRSHTININCDETFELGRGRSREACAERGRGRVYLEFVRQLIEGLHAQGRRVQFWGDVLASHPELVGELPRDGLVALVWGYEAPLDPETLPHAMVERLARLGVPTETLRGFAARVRPFVEADLPFWVCPGTSSWNSLVGRLPNALANLRDAAEVGLEAGACGYLITDWGDNGHLQPPSISFPPLVYGAALSWCLETNRDLALEDVLGRFVLEDPTREAAAALCALGGAGDAAGLQTFNASPLFLPLLRSREASLPIWGEPDAQRLTRIVDSLDEACARLERASLTAPDAPSIRRELVQAARLARHGAWRLARAYDLPAPAPAELRSDLEARIAEQRETWLARSRPGGLEDSLERLRRALRDYGPEAA